MPLHSEARRCFVKFSFLGPCDLSVVAPCSVLHVHCLHGVFFIFSLAMRCTCKTLFCGFYPSKATSARKELGISEIPHVHLFNTQLRLSNEDIIRQRDIRVTFSAIRCFSDRDCTLGLTFVGICLWSTVAPSTVASIISFKVRDNRRYSYHNEREKQPSRRFPLKID